MTRPAHDDALFRLTGVGVVETDMGSGRFRRVNDAFCAMLGYREAELLRMTFRDVTHPDDLPGDEARFRALQRGALQASQSRTRVLHKDGRTVWFELSVTVLGEGPEAVNLAIVNDVSARQQAEAALRTSEQKYRTMFASIGEGVSVLEVLFDGDGGVFDYRFVENNPAVEAMTGVVGSAGKTVLELFPEFDRRLIERAGEVARTGVPARFQHFVPALGRWFDVHEARVGGEGSRTVIAAFAEITERKRAEEAVRDSEARLRIAVEAAELGTWTWNLENGEVRWNDRHFTLFGMTPRPGPLTAEDFARRVHPEDREGVLERLSNAAAENQVFRAEFRAVTERGETRWMSGYGQATATAPGGQVLQMSGVMQDVTERKEAEIALREFSETLEQRVEERTEQLKYSQQRFSQAFYANPIPACMTSFGRETFLEVNAALLELTGYEHDEVVGHTSRELGMWSSAEDQKKLGAAQREQRGFHDLGLKLRTKAGEVRDILVSAEVIRLDGHDGYLKMFYDVTETRRTERQLMQAIQEVMQDTAWFSQSVLERFAQIKGGGSAQETVELSPRERQVLAGIAQGKSNAVIAEELELKMQTVRNYVATIYDKLGVHTRAEAVVWARERGLAGF